ncbi:hypothetical protein BDV37DRAFT_292457 [Aspergillus pseudonomiae]|uniref:Major facilitator superfamily (MFS) profile domain-containing protein n=1 Tax=Aspergillus pseudonomiae TaxID=1506151 RepID=A0A5N7DIH0_9EURO|nr:uncharacterized protein BDV37DRAFT_292457 [Aspergillus pseudonomiae]KAE8406241.1 hypothetical protein BDV37DRAFT_292457 [Aspergillus pseudonomiae]
MGQAFWCRGPGLSTRFTIDDYPYLRPQKGNGVDYASFVQAQVELTTIFGNIHDILYASKTRTVQLMLMGDYTKYLDDSSKALAMWKEAWANVNLPHYLSGLLCLQFEYLRLYINAFAFQAVLYRTPKGPAGCDSGKSSYFPYSVMASADGRHIYIAIDAAKSVLKYLMERLNPTQHFRYIPVRFYLYEIHASVFLFKALTVGALNSEEHQTCTTLVRQFISMLKSAATSPSHIASRYGKLLTSLWFQGQTTPDTTDAFVESRHSAQNLLPRPIDLDDFTNPSMIGSTKPFQDDFPTHQVLPLLEPTEALECPDVFLSNLPFLRGGFPDLDAHAGANSPQNEARDCVYPGFQFRNSATPQCHDFLISLSACGASMLFGFDMGVIGGVLTMNSFKEQYGLIGREDTVLANLESNIVSVIQAGSFLGALVSTYVANAIGRRLSLILSALILFVGVAMQAGASGIIGVLFIGGLSIGIASSVCPIYIAENAPRGIRGLLTGFYQLTLVFGLTLAFWINYGCERHLTGKEQFIIPLSLQAFPAMILLVGMFFANESPRYLAMKWPERASRVLATLRGLPEDHPYVMEELNNLRLQLEEESQHSVSSMWSLLRESFSRKSYRRRSILCITLMMWSNMTGTNAMTYYSPTIFASVGLSSSSVGLFATGIYGIVKFIACGIFIVFVSDTLGRRRSLLWTGIVQGIMLFYVGFYVRFDTISENAPITPQGYIALIAIYLFAAVYQFGWGPVEIPPARLRALNMGMATASQWFFNFVVAKSTPTMFATLGKNGYGAYFVYGSFCFVMVIYTWFFVPETKGLSLEFMDELFERDTVRGQFIPTRDVHYLAGKSQDE